MNIPFKIMAFSLILNIAIGVMITAIPAFEQNPALTAGLAFEENKEGIFVDKLEQNINPQGVLEDRGNAIYRLLDTLNIGFIGRFLQTVKTYIFGFVNLLDLMFGQFLDTPLRAFLFGNGFGVFYVLMTLIYIWGAFTLWTGKRLND